MPLFPCGCMPQMLARLRAEFAYMDGRIDPPSSLRGLTAEALTSQAVARPIRVTCAHRLHLPDAEVGRGRWVFRR